jgi:putative Mg2+ transporter-C (MgtC) family protein
MEYGFDPTFVIFGKLAFAAFLGLLMGTERVFMAHQAAGPRTFALVSLGACVFVLAGSSVNSQFIGLVNFDPARVLAAVVQGIGFLGAGLIIFRGDSLHGVTTAAGLWVAAGVGALVAFSMFKVAFFVALLALVIFWGLWYVEHHAKRWVARQREDDDSSAS